MDLPAPLNMHLYLLLSGHDSGQVIRPISYNKYLFNWGDVLKKMSITFMSTVKINRIASKKSLHAFLERFLPSSSQEVKVVGHEGPGIDNQSLLPT